MTGNEVVPTSQLAHSDIKGFQNFVWDFYRNYGRQFPWRSTTDPYRIWGSEIMLQQTQTERVLPKYGKFMQRFPMVDALAAASLAEILTLWVGLGYNRRAKFMHQAAQKIVNEYHGHIPDRLDLLESLPGIGRYTARAITAFAFAQPTIFVETNIRTVYLYHFLTSSEKVSDLVIENYVAQTIDQTNPREWYYALMDYGVVIKRLVGNMNTRSKAYLRQSTFKGSIRQVRGAVIRNLSVCPMSYADLVERLPQTDLNVNRIVDILVKEELIEYSLTGQLRLKS